MAQAIRSAVNITTFGNQILASVDGFDIGFVDTMNRTGGRYTKGAGGYTFPSGALPKLLKALEGSGVEVRMGKQVNDLADAMSKPLALPVSPNRTPFAHQVSGAQYILANANALVLDEMGLGKGFETTLATEARMLDAEAHGKKFRCLVLVPASMLYVWLEDEIMGNDKTPAIWPHRKAHIFNPKKPIPEDTDYLICSWDLFRATEKYLDKHGEECKRFKYVKMVHDWKADQIIGDEIYKIKNKKSMTAKAVNEIDTTFSIGLTGTLIPNKIEDCWFPVNYFRPGALPSWTKFLDRYALRGNRFSAWAITGYKNQDELADILSNESIRRLRKDVLDMPERTFVQVKYDMTPAQRRLYERYRDEIMDTMNEDGEINTMIMLTKLIRLGQIANNPRLMGDEFPMITTKYDALIEKIEDLNEPIIVWSSYRQTLEYMKERLGEDAEIIYGGVSARKRQDIIKSFQAGNLKVFLGMPAACREGITLTRSAITDYLDRTFNLVDRLQSRDRNYRIGQRNNVLVTDHVVPKTVDEFTFEALSDKEQTLERMTRPTDGEGNVMFNRDMLMRCLDA